MNLWLLTIGAVSIIWPVLVAFALQREVNRCFGSEATSRSAADFAVMKNVTENHLKLQSIIKEQDYLIAALWAKTYGYRASEDEYFIHSWAQHPIGAFGAKPHWTITVFEDPKVDSEFGGLGRIERYPWE